MKRMVKALLLGICFISLESFTDDRKQRRGSRGNQGARAVSADPGRTVNPFRRRSNEAHRMWLNSLHHEDWQERQEAVKNWKTHIHSGPQDVFFSLTGRLGDENLAIRNLTIEIFEEMSESYPYFIPEIAEALGKKYANDTEELVLKKTEMLNQFLGKVRMVTLSLPNSVKILEAVYERSEEGLSIAGKPKVQAASVELSGKALDQFVEQIHYVSSSLPDNTKVVSLISRGLQIAFKGITSESSEGQLFAEKILKEVFQKNSLPEAMTWKLVSELAGKGFSSSNVEVRKGVIVFLTATAEIYPALASQINSLVKRRLKKEKSRRVKDIFNKALEKLAEIAKSNSQNTNDEGQTPVFGKCEESWAVEKSTN